MSVDEKLKVLRNHESSLMTALCEHDDDLHRTASELLEYDIISEATWDKFTSLDHYRMDSNKQVRYLLQQVYERIREDKMIYDKLVRVLSRLGGTGRGVCEAMRKELDGVEAMRKELHGVKISQGSSGDGAVSSMVEEVTLTMEDIPDLVEELASASHKWEEIAIALGLPAHVRMERRYGGSSFLELLKVIEAWIAGNYMTVAPTLGSLRKALSSKTVGLPHISHRLLTYKESEEPLPLVKKPKLGLGLQIDFQSYDTEVLEGKSTLLEVHVDSDGSESYQWSKDGHPLPDGTDFSGASSNILYINRAGQGTEGKYSCTISNGNKIVCTNEINLNVIYPVEKKHLIQLYSSVDREVPHDIWPPKSNPVYMTVSLCLVKSSCINRFCTVRGNVDDILESKEKVTYDEVFSEYREGALVLVEGRPGSGKTTLLNKVTRDWARGKAIRGAKMTFQISLRGLRGRDKCLVDMLEIFYADVHMRKTVILELEKSLGKGACFIIDGLNEYQHRNMEESVIHQLIYKKFLPSSMIIVASRPVATSELKKQNHIMHIEVLGFSKSQIYEYVETYPFYLNVVSELKAFLYHHPNILQMCYLPVHLAVICFLFSQQKGDLPRTETQVYEQFTIAILKRHILRYETLEHHFESLKDLSEGNRIHFMSICKLAYHMLINFQGIVGHSDAASFLYENPYGTEPGLGLLTVQLVPQVYGVDRCYSFLHLTFQEFLAAYHIANLNSKEQSHIIAEFGRGMNSQLKNALKFYCGIMGAGKDIFFRTDEFLQNLLGRAEDDPFYFIQCVFEAQCVELSNYLIKDCTFCLFSKLVTASDFAALGYVLSAASKRVSKLIFMGCKWEYDDAMALTSWITRDQQQSIRQLQVSLECSEYSCRGMNGLLSQLPYLEELDLVNQRMSVVQIECLTRNLSLSYLKILKIRLPLAPDSYSGEILKLLSFGSSNIERVYFHWDLDECYQYCSFPLWKKMLCYAFGFQVFVDSDISWVCLYNSDSFPSLCPERFSYCTEVFLVNCGIDDEGAELLASRLNTSVLENFVVDFNRICDSGAVALAGCMSRCGVVQVFSIECNCIGDSGATALASALVNCSSLRRLDLQGNGISDEGAVAIAKAAKDLPHLDLYLHNVKITEEGVEKVLELRARTKIRTMEFSSSWKAISAAGIDTVRSALKCGSLSTLQIWSISDVEELVHELELVRHFKRIVCMELITEATLRTFCDLIRSVNRLEYLHCDISSISSAGAQNLVDTLKTCKFLHSVTLRSYGHDLPVLVDIVKCCNNIQSLDLAWCLLGADGVIQLCSDQKSWLNLCTLNLGYNHIGSDGVHVLSKVLAHCNNLCFLDLGDNNIDDSGCSYLAEGLQDHTRLLGLKLRKNNITSDGVAALIPVIKNNHLQELDLSDCKIGSEGVVVLMEVICTDTLQTLKLSFTGIGIEGVVALSAGLKNCKELVELDISHNNIGPHGMSSLAESLQFCTNLQVLNLGDNITSDGVAGIVGIMKTCKYLKELCLYDTSLSVDDVADLVRGWQHENVLILDWSPDDPHRSALLEGKGCCSSCDHLLEVYNNNDYVVLPSVQNLVFLK